MAFDCHGQPIALPANLDGVFAQPPSFIHLHEIMEQLEPALKEIFTRPALVGGVGVLLALPAGRGRP
jgi:hypothetical protein